MEETPQRSSFSLSPTTRQTTRALQEIQSQRPGLLVMEEHGISLAHIPIQPTDITERVRWSVNLSDALDTPSPSPDEMAILARGRRRIPLTYSPDLCTSTPLARHQARARLGTRLLLPNNHPRTSPRKRLTLSDSPPGAPCSPSPDKTHLQHSPLAKRLCLGHAAELVTAARGLTQQQLVTLLSSLLERHPELAPEVLTTLPLPDLTAMEESLNYHKRNIYKALPSTRLESKTDSMAYNRVSVHLVTFKKAVSDGLRMLLESQHWLSAIDFTVLAWAHVKSTPLWSNPSHNTVRRTCFKLLATGCMRSLR